MNTITKERVYDLIANYKIKKEGHVLAYFSNNYDFEPCMNNALVNVLQNLDSYKGEDITLMESLISNQKLTKEQKSSLKLICKREGIKESYNYKTRAKALKRLYHI